MRLLRLLGFLWMLRASTGARGPFPMAASTSAELFHGAEAARTALSNSPSSRGAARWPLSTPSRAPPAPNSREHTFPTPTTSPHFKPISEPLLKTTVKSNTSTIPRAKLVIKVETTPPTLIVYTSTTKCINPTSLIITTTYPTTCMTLTVPERLTSAMTSPPATTSTLGKTPPTMALLSSSVSAHTHVPTSSTTGSTERPSLSPASIHAPRSLTPVIPSTSVTPSLTAANISATVTGNDSPPSTSASITTTSLPHTASTSKTAAAPTHDPTSTTALTTPTAQSVSAPTGATAPLSTPPLTSKTTSSMKTKLILGSDSPRETLTTGITLISPIPSSIIPTNTVVSATSAASETALEPTATNIYTTFTATEPLSSTVAATRPGKMAVAPSHAVPTRKTTLTPTKDISPVSLMTEMTSPPTITSLTTPRNTVNSPTPASSLPVNTNTLTSAMRTHPPSPPAPSTESDSTWSTNTTPISTLITTLPTTHVTSTPVSPMSTGTMATTEITTPPSVATTATSNTASLPPSSTPETTTTIVVTTPTPAIPHSTPGVTSSNIYSKGSTATSAMTPTPSTTGAPRITSSINSSSVSTSMPNSTLATITPTSRGPTGSLTTTTDLTSTTMASSILATPTSISPSIPTVQNTDLSSGVITTSTTMPAVAPMLSSTRSTPPPTLATNTAVTSVGSSSVSSSRTGAVQTGTTTSYATGTNTWPTDTDPTPASATTDAHTTPLTVDLPSSATFTTYTRKMTVTPSHAPSPGKTTLIPTGDVWTQSLTTEITSPLATTSSVTPANTVGSLTLTTSTPVTTNTLTSAMSRHLSSPPAPTTESVSTLTTNTTPASTLITTLLSTNEASTPVVTTATSDVTTPTNASMPTPITATLPTPSTPDTAATVTTMSVTTPTPTPPPSTSCVSPTSSFPSLSTSTNAITTSFGTIISSSVSTTIMSPSLSSTSVNSMLTTTTNSLSTSSPLSSVESTGSSAAAFTTPFPSETIRTSPTTSPLKTFATETTTTCFISSATQCPESVSVTIAPASPTTSFAGTGPSSEATSLPTIPVSVFTSTTEMATSLSPTSRTTALPVHMDTSTVLETHPTNSLTDAPSSISTRTVPSYTVWTRPTSGNRMSTNPVTIPHTPRFTSLPLTTKPSSNFPTAMVTSVKSTHSTSTTTKTPETPAVTSQSATTLTSPRTSSTTTQMTTRSRLTTTPGTCDNGGTWMQGLCHCPLGFSGPHCELQEIRCQNGGKWDGFKCHCPSTFYGSRCEFVVEQVDLDSVDAEVGMEVSVDQEFSPDLNDNTSTAYKDFSDTFRDQMRKIYQNVKGFKDVEILSLRSGSIVVDYVVLLELPFSLQLESEYMKVKTVLKEELQNVSHDGDSCQNNQTLCFKPDSIKVNNNTRKELTLEAICRRATAKGYEDFYFPLVEENRLRCVTKCTSGVDGTIDCQQGQCLVEKSGPACRCFSTDTHWFSGPRCEVAIALRALVGGLVGVLALLLLLLASLSLFVVARSRSRRVGQGGSRSCDDDRKWFEIWDEDTVGTFSSNLGLEDHRTVKDEHFQVALENVDTNVHIQRPEVGLVLAVSPALPPRPCPRPWEETV